MNSPVFLAADSPLFTLGFRFNSQLPIFVLANGWLPTRGSWVLDTVFVAMFVIVAIMLVSIGLVRWRRAYATHRSMQIGLAIVLAIAIVVFEIDIRFFTDWRTLAQDSAFFASGWVQRVLYVHLLFAIPTPIVWGYVIVAAVKHFGGQPQPGTYSRTHRFWGRVAAGMMLMTAMTGCVFYWLAFVA